MTRWLARWLGRFAEAFAHEYRLAAQARHDRKQPAFITRPIFGDAHDPQMRLVNEFVLRDALYRSLRKYSPHEPPAEA
jgi:hypothetical protein